MSMFFLDIDHLRNDLNNVDEINSFPELKAKLIMVCDELKEVIDLEKKLEVHY